MKEKAMLPQNEIDAIWELLKRFKLMILGITIAFTLSAIVYAFTIHKPIYSSIALVQMGKKNNALVETTKIFELKFLNKYKIKSLPEQTLPRISKVKIINKPGGLVRLYAEGYDKDELKKYLEVVIQNIAIDHNESITEYIQENNQSLILAKSNLEKQKELLTNIETKIKENEVKIKTFTNKDQTLINMYLFQMLRDDMSIEPLSEKVATYTRQVSRYTKILSKKKTFETHMLNEVVALKKPVTPSKLMLIGVALVSSLLFSLLLAFFLGFLADRKK